MDERQKEAAERALHRLEMDELIKRIALKHRTACLNDISFFGLPFRILFSLKQPESQIPLSKFYPFRAASAGTEAKISEALAEARERQGDLSEAEARAIQKEIESIDYTPEDMRDYYFTPFLAGWDFSTFRLWDWTGDPVPENEAAALQEHYWKRQRDFMEHPEKYAVPALIKDDDMGRYSPERQELLTLLDDLPDD